MTRATTLHPGPATTRPISFVLLVVAALAALALPVLLGLAFASPTGRALSDALAAAVSPWERGPWKVLRGGLKWITPPVLAVAVPWALVHLALRGRRTTAIVGLVVGAGAFLTAEAVKHGFVPFPAYGLDGTRPLSGHVAMVSAAFVVAVLAAPEARRRTVTLVAWVLLAGACLGIIASRWHDTGDVVITIAIAVTWVVLGAVVLAALPRARAERATVVASARGGEVRERERARRRADGPLLAGTGLLAAAAGTLVFLGSAATGTSPVQTLAASTLAALSMTLLLCCAAEVLARSLDAQDASNHSRRGAVAGTVTVDTSLVARDRTENP